MFEIFYLYQKKTRTKREAIRGAPEAGCSYVFADGSADARDLKGPEYFAPPLYAIYKNSPFFTAGKKI